MTRDEQAIRELVDTWMRASRSGDAAIVLSLMTEDAVFMVPSREPFGREAFEAAVKAENAPQIEGTNEIVEIQVFGVHPEPPRPDGHSHRRRTDAARRLHPDAFAQRPRWPVAARPRC
jgi:Domain of unknown function (DUF4440)